MNAETVPQPMSQPQVYNKHRVHRHCVAKHAKTMNTVGAGATAWHCSPYSSPGFSFYTMDIMWADIAWPDMP